ncbi:hypothetical protein TorRG33x02_174690 [Trema orientale]|uniref:Uncharacterized protein n=1 Tax=Trema orientale TaxID=63057 RepID=A0A2P5EMK3_TREOI|nr:hypothetical protein TorRG33x02_174690 [Trema orientale]
MTNYVSVLGYDCRNASSPCLLTVIFRRHISSPSN